MDTGDLTAFLPVNPLTKSVGTFLYGAGGTLAHTNFYPARGYIVGRIEDSLDEETPRGLPHWSPQKETALDDLLGEIFFNTGMFSAIALEGGGLFFTGERLYHGDVLSAALYPAAKVVTNGLAWLMTKYSKNQNKNAQPTG